jgi:hypothetical protein
MIRVTTMSKFAVPEARGAQSSASSAEKPSANSDNGFASPGFQTFSIDPTRPQPRQRF